MNTKYNLHDYFNEFNENDIGPVEIEEKNDIFWNCLDWPNYIKCPLNTELSSLIKIIQEGWNLYPPQIILSILSDLRSLDKWQNIDRIKQFQQGLVKAASSAKTWIITNGLSIGASKIISEAIVNEKNWQQSLINSNGQKLKETINNDHFLSKANFSKKKQAQQEAKSFLNNFNQNENILKDKNLNNIFSKSPITKTVIIGVIDGDKIVKEPYFYRQKENFENSSNINSRIKYAKEYDLKFSSSNQFQKFHKPKKCFTIDQNHSHFIFVQKSKEDEHDDENLLALELFYELSYLGAWLISKKPDNLQQRITIQKVKNLRIPFIGILMQGDFQTSVVCCNYLLKQIPILVLQGSGGFADLLSYAYLELSVYSGQQQENINRLYKINSNLDVLKNHQLFKSILNVPNEYLDKVLKPSLLKKIKQAFPNQSKEIKDYAQQFLDKILECVYYANQEGIEYVTLLNLNNSEIELINLDEYLLHNYLKCRQANLNEVEIRPKEDLDNDLKLTINWNNCKIAKQLLKRYLKTDYFTIDKSLFLDALTKKNRESFVELFLEFGFKLRSIYTFETLTWLIQKSSKNNLFSLICCENILNIPHNKSFPLDHEFINFLNKLLYMTCKLKNFVNLNELTNRYNTISICIEQKALIFFTLWSVLTFNIELTKKLWPFSTYPIHLLLIISKTLTTLSKFSYDLSMRKELEEQIKYFNLIALDLLNKCHSESSSIAIETISKNFEHWNNYFAIDIAASIQHHELITHQCSQEWIDFKLMNGIHLKHSGLGEFVNSIKILLSILFIFPIFFWFDYPQNVLNDQINIDLKKQSLFKKAISRIKNFLKRKSNKKSIDQNELNKNDLNSYRLHDINLLDKWILLITSPMSKYVIYFFSWFIFLIFFSYTIVIPGCGNLFLDTISFTCISIYCLEMVRKNFIKNNNYMHADYRWDLLEFVIIILFLIYFYHDRLNLNNFNKYTYRGRIMMLCILFFAYLKLLSIFMPMYNTLGPLSYRIRLMSLHDILLFASLVWPFLIAFGVSIEAALYPDRSMFDNKLYLQSVFHRTLITLFRTPYHELTDENERCDSYHSSKPFYNSTHCQIGSYNDFNCNNRSFFSHFYLFSYIFFIKSLMLTLLYALFNASMFNVEMTTIWRYQRFFLIVDFDLNYPLPPPFCAVFYLFYSLKFLFKKLNHLTNILKTNEEQILLNDLNYFKKQDLSLNSTIVKNLTDENLLKFSNKNLIKSTQIDSNCKHCSNESIVFFWRSLCRDLSKSQSKHKK